MFAGCVAHSFPRDLGRGRGAVTEGFHLELEAQGGWRSVFRNGDTRPFLVFEWVGGVGVEIICLSYTVNTKQLNIVSSGTQWVAASLVDIIFRCVKKISHLYDSIF